MTSRRLLFISVSLALLGGETMAQKKPAGGKKPAQASAKIEKTLTPIGEVRVLDKKEATQLVARLKNLVLSKKARRDKKKKKGKSYTPSFIDRLQEVEAIGQVQHSSLARLLKKVMLHDPNDAVRIKAAEALLAQPKKDAVKIARELLKERKFLERGSLAAPMIRIVSFYGAPKDTWKRLRQRFLDIGSLGQQALLEHIGERKDWDHIGLILDNIEAPAPANVDDPNNPPASYWKGRWEQWSAFQPALKEACRKLFGKTFKSRRDAELWISEKGGIKQLRKASGK